MLSHDHGVGRASGLQIIHIIILIIITIPTLIRICTNDSHSSINTDRTMIIGNNNEWSSTWRANVHLRVHLSGSPVKRVHVAKGQERH